MPVSFFKISPQVDEGKIRGISPMSRSKNGTPPPLKK
jgi:hypothetical protein